MTLAVVSIDHQNYDNVVIPSGGNRYISDGSLTFHQRTDKLLENGDIPPNVANILKSWNFSYLLAAKSNPNVKNPEEQTESMYFTLLELVRLAIRTPHRFNSYHERVRHPFDFYKFGCDFISVLLNWEESCVIGQDKVYEAEAYARQGHNIVFLSNHQSEGDPYAIDALLEGVVGASRDFCENMIFMAGDRVRDDPVVAPFSAGRSLLTVYSKKHINDVPELLNEKRKHNHRTIFETQRLFKEGGKVVWFAPSGGRDRRSSKTNRIEMETFDEGAIDMMRVIVQKSRTPCHFYPMSLLTHNMLPPPTNVGGAQVGEERTVNYSRTALYVADEIDWSQSISLDVVDKLDRRRAQRDYVQNIVKDGYTQIGGYEQ